LRRAVHANNFIILIVLPLLFPPFLHLVRPCSNRSGFCGDAKQFRAVEDCELRRGGAQGPSSYTSRSHFPRSFCPRLLYHNSADINTSRDLFGVIGNVYIVPFPLFGEKEKMPGRVGCSFATLLCNHPVRPSYGLVAHMYYSLSFSWKQVLLLFMLFSLYFRTEPGILLRKRLRSWIFSGRTGK
jgi:hypothetical protein